MGYKSAINSTENLAKAVARLPHHFRNQFYKCSKGKITNQEYNKIKIGEETFPTGAGSERSTKCWICSENHFVCKCREFESKPVADHSGSDSTLICEETARKLGLGGKEQSLRESTILSNSQTFKSKIVSFNVHPTNLIEEIRIEKAWVVPDLNTPTEKRNITDLKEKYVHLKDIDIPTFNDDRVTVLIGIDTPSLHMQHDYRVGKHNEPVAVKTQLGWILFGGKNKNIFTNINRLETDTDNLNKAVERFWEIESYGTKPPLHPDLLTKDEKHALHILKSTTKMKDGHFEVGLLWKDEKPKLPYDCELAVQRLKSNERKLSKQPILAENYRLQVKEYIALGHARKLSDFEKNQTSDITNYIPHHGVVHPNKPRKVRVVFDAAAAKYKGISLNDNLLPGPDLLNNLVSVLLTFRTYRYAITADIEKMFHQVKVSKIEQDALRFVWRENTSDNIDDIATQVHLFGKVDSPCCANYALRQTSIDHDREIVDAITKKFYMDDYLGSMKMVDEAVSIAKTVTEALTSCGFRLTKWLSNSCETLKCFPKTETVINVNLYLNKLPTERVLGMIWNPNTDYFTFKVVNKPSPETKRGILSLTSSIFDPLGILTPFILEGKLIIQSLWKSKIDWDEEIPTELKTRWLSRRSELEKLTSISIPRWLKLQSDNQLIQLHIFSDASINAYGAVAYLRIQDTYTVNVTFVMGQSRVAPLNPKSLTIPKLELQAAVLATRMRESIVSSLFMDLSTKFWIESQIVLKYISKENRKFSVFVMNRINEIRTTTDVNSWRFVPETLNPADNATRSVPLSSTENSRWLTGPSLLIEEECNWPDQNQNVIQSEEDADITNFQSTRENIFYQMGKLFRLRGGSEREKFDYLTVDEIEATKLQLYSISQQESYPLEFENLQSYKELPKRSPLVALRPMMQNNLIRVGGRIGLIDIPFESKHQLIISPKHHIARLIIQHIHHTNFHVEQNATLALPRQNIWIPTGKSYVKNLINACTYCKSKKVIPMSRLMGDLPIDRLAVGELPFNQSGVDYFGQMIVKRSKRTRASSGTVKRYGALFTCMTSRAVHIELARDLSTDSFILALRRYISRRGNPKTITSDKGTNFVGADRELRELVTNLNETKLRKELTKNSIKWKFNPPFSPWMNGAMESMVKITKRALKATVRDRVFTEEELRTFLTEVEATINSRPLTSISSDADDYQALTPNHFPIGRASQNAPVDSVFTDLDARKRWRAVQVASNMFWNRWRKEYLPSLTTRAKWNTNDDQIKEGDLVIVRDQNVLKNHWPLGRIAKIFPGSDGINRIAEVKTADGIYNRPIRSLALLERSAK
ncbi:uncharacterized protein LOC130648433 [Hydractinia symbiolongicarpus]|uniref:uncharacterized protein LOC130648433 n=1 Tax=Hydractinia symbiolongicarpus TaxID=13093 RepID=UPI002550B701|nr:uncharacterized protein LOC130648433 [Hydractinia symbiolongicarpus]